MSELPDRIALIGLGNMGGPLARAWLEAGVEVHGADISAGALERLEADGGVPHDTAAGAAGSCDVTVLMLPASPVVDDVLTALLDSRALRAGSTVLDMSSSEPMRSIANAQRLADAEVDFMDAPVSGGVRGVHARNLAIMAGGPSRTVGRMMPLLSAVGTVTHVGDVGTGHAAKALNNLVSATHLFATSEAVLIAERFGIPRQTMVDLLNASTGRSVSSEVKWPRFILDGSYDSGFHASLLSKDATVAAELAESLGLPALLASSVAEQWRRVVGDLPAGADHTEVARWIEDVYRSSGPTAMETT